MTNLNCIYCDGRHGSDQWTLEHIWPQALGGSACSDLFKSRLVCKACNDRAGLWVDGIFLRSFFGGALRANSSARFRDPHKPKFAPFIFMGVDEAAPIGKEEICERWIGPNGESVCFFHERDEDRWSGYAGGNIIRRKQGDPGRAYMTLVDKGGLAAGLAVGSLPKQFPNARLHLLTRVSGLPDEIAEKYVPEAGRLQSENTEANWMWDTLNGEPLALKMQADVNFYRRFFAKLALGLGHSIIGPNFLKTPYAEGLRAILWPNLNFGNSDLIMGNSFWDAPDPKLKHLHWPGAWTLMFAVAANGLGLTVFLPDGKMMVIQICDDPNLVLPLREYHDGLVYVIVPERNASVGPCSLMDYIAHRLKNVSMPMLREIESWEARTESSGNPN